MALTNTQMQAILAAGGSVVWQGAVITDASLLPTDNQIALAAGQLQLTVAAGTTDTLNQNTSKIYPYTLTVNGVFNCNGVAVVQTF